MALAIEAGLASEQRRNPTHDEDQRVDICVTECHTFESCLCRTRLPKIYRRRCMYCAPSHITILPSRLITPKSRHVLGWRHVSFDPPRPSPNNNKIGFPKQT